MANARFQRGTALRSWCTGILPPGPLGPLPYPDPQVPTDQIPAPRLDTWLRYLAAQSILARIAGLDLGVATGASGTFVAYPRRARMQKNGKGGSMVAFGHRSSRSRTPTLCTGCTGTECTQVQGWKEYGLNCAEGSVRVWSSLAAEWALSHNNSKP
jgi:hypothetical protein